MPRRGGKPKMSVKPPRGLKAGKGPRGSERLASVEGELIKTPKHSPAQTYIEHASQPAATTGAPKPRTPEASGPPRETPAATGAPEPRTPQPTRPVRHLGPAATPSQRLGTALLASQGFTPPAPPLPCRVHGDVPDLSASFHAESCPSHGLPVRGFAEGGVSSGKGIWAIPHAFEQSAAEGLGMFTSMVAEILAVGAKYGAFGSTARVAVKAAEDTMEAAKHGPIGTT